MQKRYLWALAGALSLTVSAWIPALAAPPEGTPPPNWTAEDLNGADPPGSTKVEGSGAEAKWTVTGGGTDIQNEDFHFAYTTLPGDGGITARLLSQTGGHSDGWAKTGVMLRKTTDAGSGMMTLNYAGGTGHPGRGVEGLYRIEQDEATEYPGAAAGVGPRLDSGPIWMRVQRQGQTYEMLTSRDGKDWIRLVKTEMSIPANEPVLAGLTACMHGGEDGPVTAVFDNVSVSAEIVKPAPEPWGPVNAYPGTGAVLLTFGLYPGAEGYNIYRQGPGEQAAVKLNAEPTRNAWFIDNQGLTNGTSYRYSVRPVVKDAAGALTEGPVSRSVLAEPQVPIAPGLFSYDLGTQTPGSTKLVGDVLEIQGSGADIQQTAVFDQFRFVAMPVVGDYSVTAKILEKPTREEGSTQTWVKAGIMIRSSLDPGAAMATVFLTRGVGIGMEYRLAPRGRDVTIDGNNVYGGSNPLGDAEVEGPVWLRLTRVGETIKGAYSLDGSTYEEIENPAGLEVQFPRLPAVTYAGFAVTSHDEGRLTTAKFDATVGLQLEAVE